MIAATLIGIFSFVAPILMASGDIGRYLFVPDRLFAPWPLVRPGWRSARVPLQPGISLHRCISHLRYLVADRRRFCTIVALGFSSKFGLFAVGLYLLSGAACTIVALFFSRKLDMPSLITLTVKTCL